ncbi:MAG: hypothetical protein QXY40_08645 [Candidatus Methanomethylicia archaeon]
MEVKSLIEIDDIEWFNQKCEIVERIIGRKPRRKIAIGINMVKEAYERTKELNIEAIYGAIIE